jgi:16S rRNA (adenine1518-N6/adenine1519-N6)-dimethyltransferase
MNLSEMRDVLARGDIQLTRSLGQNFLHDQNQLRKIVAAADLAPGDKVLEIGPGLGPLTELLVQQAGRVLAIEKDARLYEFLERKFTPQQMDLVHDDALDVVKTRRKWAGWKLVANLPYSVASPILVELAEADEPPQRMVGTLQMEVARRIAAKAGEDDYGVLSLLLQLRYEPVGFFKIPASCFFPAPDVDSACITLLLRAQPLLARARERSFTKIVKRAFSQRRKMMFKLLKGDWPVEELERAFSETEISVRIRAEAVSLEQFITLTNRLCAT